MTQKSKLFLAVGGVILLLCCGGMFYALRNVAEVAKKLIEGGADFATASLKTVSKDWSIKSLKEVSLPAVTEGESGVRATQMFAKYKSQLGELKTAGGWKLMQWETNSQKEKGGPLVFNYVSDCKFAKADGRVSIVLENLKAIWKVKGFTVYSKALGNLKDQPVLKPGQSWNAKEK